MELRAEPKHPRPDHLPGVMRMELAGRAAQSQQTLAYARACWPDGTEPEQHLLALHLTAILALDDALDSDRPLTTSKEEQRTLLPWIGKPRSVEGSEAFIRRGPIRAALARAEGGLARCAGSDERAMDWWRRQGELMVATIWEECRWRNSRILPTESEYLAVTEVSIGIRWIVASLLLLDGVIVPSTADSPISTATSAVAAAVRVANDLHDTKRERREGKVQLLFLKTRALQALGYPRRAAERRARHELQAVLVERVARAKVQLDPGQWRGSPRLRSGLIGMLTAAVELVHMQELVADGDLQW
jgi:hypothetical protein